MGGPAWKAWQAKGGSSRGVGDGATRMDELGNP